MTRANRPTINPRLTNRTPAQHPAPSPEERRRIQREAEGLCDLGLFGEARRCAEEALGRWECEVLRCGAMEIALRQKDFAAAERHADVLLTYPEPLDPCFARSVPIVLHYAGRATEAYEMICSLTADKEQPPNAWYNLACYALPAGRHEESLQALLKCLAEGRHEGWEPWRKAFLDSDLAPLWDYVRQREYRLRDAIEWAHLPLEAVIRENEPPERPRQVDYNDLDLLPRRLHGLLRRTFQNTALVDSSKARSHPRIFRRYLVWQEWICRPRVETFAHLVREVRGIYDHHVPDMVRFCVGRKRLGPARFILRQFALRHPEVDPSSLPEFPGLEYWTDEWKELRQVSPDGLKLLLNATNFRGDVALRQGFQDLPERVRDSGTGWMAWGRQRFLLGCHEEALQCFARAAEFWPKDENVYINIINTLMHLERHEEAMKASNHPSLLALPEPEREYLLRAILDRKTEVSPRRITNLDFPTPASNDMSDQADQEFVIAKAILSSKLSPWR